MILAASRSFSAAREYMAAALWHHTPHSFQPSTRTDMQSENLTPHQLVTLAQACPEVLVLWLYGSRAYR